MKTFSTTDKMKTDSLFIAALPAISNIMVREWPEEAPLFTFASGFESDVKSIRNFCANRNIFDKAREYSKGRWDVVVLLNTPLFLYYLRAILLSMIRYPKSAFTRVLLGRVFDRYSASITKDEALAAGRTVDYLHSKGVSADDLRKQFANAGAKRSDRRRLSSDSSRLGEGGLRCL